MKNNKVIQCDARCYNATETSCGGCACGGLNHGIGEQLAIIRTRANATQWAEREGVEKWTVAPTIVHRQRERWANHPGFVQPPSRAAL